MGQGISGVLPLKLVKRKGVTRRRQRVLPGLLDCYEVIDEDSDKFMYGIKTDILFSGFKQYFQKLEPIFKDDDDKLSWINEKWDKFDEIAEARSHENLAAFLDENNYGESPSMHGGGFADTYTLEILEHITLIHGSYEINIGLD
jgi:hypothetical protein